MTNRTSETVTMYRLHSWKTEIETLHVVKQTECYITYAPAGSAHVRRERKEGAWFESWEAAHSALVDKARREVTYAEDLLQRKRSALQQVESMRKKT